MTPQDQAKPIFIFAFFDELRQRQRRKVILPESKLHDGRPSPE